MNLLFLDTETGGLEPQKHSLLQVGMVAYVNGKVIDTKEFSIREENYVVTAHALKYNELDLYENVYKNGIPRNEATQEIIRFVSKNFTELPILVGHNPSVDKYMIRKLFSDCNLNMDRYISHRMIDTMSLIWGLYFAGKLPKEACSSDGAFSYFRIRPQRRHHALSDTLATVELFEHLIELLK